MGGKMAEDGKKIGEVSARWQEDRRKSENVVKAIRQSQLLGPRVSQDGPKMAPRWPQDGPKMAPRWPKMAPRRPICSPKIGPKIAYDDPRSPKIGRRSQKMRR